MNSRGQGQRGFSLVELLIAGGIMVLLLGFLASLFIHVSRAYSVTERLADQQQKEAIAVNLLSYDVALAGYMGASPSHTARSFEQVFGTASTLEIWKRSGQSDAILVRYFEDRFVTDQDLVPTVIEYQTDKVAGVDNLYRCEWHCQGATKQPAVEGVNALIADAFILRNGNIVDIVSALDVQTGDCHTCLAAIRLKLGFNHNVQREVVIAFNNTQVVMVH